MTPPGTPSAVVVTSQGDGATTTQTTTTTTVAGGSTYQLLVNHGAALPTKVVLTADSLEQLLTGISQQLNITVPFSIVVFDPNFNVYAGVTSIQAVPQVATVQILFSTQ